MLALVVSALILVLGLRSMTTLADPAISAHQNAIVTVRPPMRAPIGYHRRGFITMPLENAIAQANGIDYMTSQASRATSTITVNLRLNYDSPARR